MLPALNILILNNSRRNMGSGERCSTNTKIAKAKVPPIKQASTKGLDQPMVE